MGERLIEQIFTALAGQTVTVPGAAAAETILPKLADSLREVLRQRDDLVVEVERMLDAHPIAGVRTSMRASGSGPQLGSCSKSAAAVSLPASAGCSSGRDHLKCRWEQFGRCKSQHFGSARRLVLQGGW